MSESTDPTDCPDCVLCRTHREPGAEEDEEDSEHDPADCDCSVASPCSACRIVAERDQLKKKLAAFTRAAAELIERTGYCVVCDRYTPFHLVDCPMGNIN